MKGLASKQMRPTSSIAVDQRPLDAYRTRHGDDQREKIQVTPTLGPIEPLLILEALPVHI